MIIIDNYAYDVVGCQHAKRARREHERVDYRSGINGRGKMRERKT